MRNEVFKFGLILSILLSVTLFAQLTGCARPDDMKRSDWNMKLEELRLRKENLEREKKYILNLISELSDVDSIRLELIKCQKRDSLNVIDSLDTDNRNTEIN